jgi:predicted transcriptional regulator
VIDIQKILEHVNLSQKELALLFRVNPSSISNVKSGRMDSFYEFVSTHTGRRSFVSNMCARRLTPQEIMPMSGHRLVEIMGIYNKTNAVDNAANLSKIFDGK